jgi:hypothetical protein
MKILSFPDSDGDPVIVLDRPSLRTSFFLFGFHKTAFMALCRYLGWDDVLEEEEEEEGQEDATAAGPIPDPERAADAGPAPERPIAARVPIPAFPDD